MKGSNNGDEGLTGLLKTIAVALVALAIFFAFLHALRANADPCAQSSCRVTGASVRLTIPIPAPGQRFAGKFELVPLFSAGHKPVIRNGHQFYAERNTISFRTDAGDLVTVFAGSTTDMASIPQPLWAILPPDGPWAEAAAIHDGLFKTSGTMLWRGHLGRSRAAPYTRAEANEILREAMVALGVPAWKRIVIYEGVRAGKYVAPGAWGT